MNDWQPIATVPDKTPVLVSNGREVWSDEWRSGWSFYSSMRGEPTHWMPLPAPPAVHAANAETRT